MHDIRAIRENPAAFDAAVARRGDAPVSSSILELDEARRTVARFVKADLAHDTVIFTKNTTEAINKLARRYPFSNRRDVVISSGMEHHSNDLPWRQQARLIHIAVHDEFGQVYFHVQGAEVTISPRLNRLGWAQAIFPRIRLK